MVVLVQFENPVRSDDGGAYIACVCGRSAADNIWEGWIEFDPGDGAPVLRTPRETTQPNLHDLEYWATGLTEAYLEGALERARGVDGPDLRAGVVVARPVYDGPAPATQDQPLQRGHGPGHAVLDPFDVYEQGEDLLRDELSALDEGHLRNIIRVHGLAKAGSVDLNSLDRGSLAELIIAAVRAKA